MGQADGPQSRVVGALQMAHGQEGIGSFETQNAADDGSFPSAPKGREALQFGAGRDNLDFTGLFQSAVPGRLGLGHGPGLGGGMPDRDGIITNFMTDSADLRHHRQADAAAAHFREADRGMLPPRFVAPPSFAGANLGERPGQVPVPLQGVEGQVEVGVQKKWAIRLQSAGSSSLTTVSKTAVLT